MRRIIVLSDEDIENIKNGVEIIVRFDGAGGWHEAIHIMSGELFEKQKSECWVDDLIREIEEDAEREESVVKYE